MQYIFHSRALPAIHNYSCANRLRNGYFWPYQRRGLFFRRFDKGMRVCYTLPRMFPKSLRTRIILVFFALATLAISLSNLLFYKRYLNIMKEDMRTYLMAVARMGTHLIDADLLATLPLKSTSRELPAYNTLQKQLQHIIAINKNIRYVYIMAPSPVENRALFIVDATALLNEPTNPRRSWPGDEFNAEKFPELIKGFYTPTADKEFIMDQWGAVFSGYAPIRDKHKKLVALLGVDMDAHQVNILLNRINREIFLSLALAILLAIILGYFFGQTITRPIQALVKDIRAITSSGNLMHPITIQSHDEIQEVAASFNILAKTLFETNVREKKLILDTIQALNLALEANEPYMNGHSQRVTELAELVAIRMDLLPHDIESIKELGLVHDIGKLSIDSAILTKTGDLTEKEREQIKKHPVEGEKILAPLVSHKPELALVRSHHERYDGTGYPDGLKDGEISIMAAILAVCDSFDAMVSERPYRAGPLSKERAIAEIKRCSGTQFDPTVVDAFIALYKERKI